MENIWEVAKKMEQEGKLFYEKLSAESTVKELTGVFDFLIEQEQLHYDTFCKFEEGEDVTVEEQVSALVKAKRIFSDITPDFKAPEGLSIVAETYEKAKSLETKTIRYYTSLLDNVDTPERKKILEKIIDEEKSHEALMTALIDFVSRPAEWLENAEFTNLDEY